MWHVMKPTPESFKPKMRPPSLGWNPTKLHYKWNHKFSRHVTRPTRLFKGQSNMLNCFLKPLENLCSSARQMAKVVRWAARRPIAKKQCQVKALSTGMRTSSSLMKQDPNFDHHLQATAGSLRRSGIRRTSWAAAFKVPGARLTQGFWCSMVAGPSFKLLGQPMP